MANSALLMTLLAMACSFAWSCSLRSIVMLRLIPVSVYDQILRIVCWRLFCSSKAPRGFCQVDLLQPSIPRGAGGWPLPLSILARQLIDADDLVLLTELDFDGLRYNLQQYMHNSQVPPRGNPCNVSLACAPEGTLKTRVNSPTCRHAARHLKISCSARWTRFKTGIAHSRWPPCKSKAGVTSCSKTRLKIQIGLSAPSRQHSCLLACLSTAGTVSVKST